jgi:two-component system, NarL family, response regulator LiaR
MAPVPIRVMVVDASPVVRAGVAAMLDRADGIDVVATAEEPLQVHRRCRDDAVDVVVMNPAVLETGAGAPAATAAGTARWFERLPAARVVVLTDVIDELMVQAVSASGIDACLHLTTVNADELTSAVRGVMRGQATFSSDFVPDLVTRRSTVAPGMHLTAREGDILELLAQGHTNESIAHALGLATGTVRIYVSGILTKLGTPNRTAAAVLAIQQGLVTPVTGAPTAASG